MVTYPRTILTWLGFLFKTSGALIRTGVRQFIRRLLGLRTTQFRLKTLVSCLLASCRPWIVPRKSNVKPTAEFTAASSVCPMPTPGNALQNTPTPAPAAQQLLQANPAGPSRPSFDSRPPSTLPTEWDPKKFKPSAPQLWKRYKGRPLVKRDTGPKPIPAKKKDFIDTTVNGWQRIIHPEGALYYYNATRRVFTDANLRDKKVLKTVNNQVDLLLSEAGDTVNDLTYLAVELPDWNSDVCSYYFVQHDARLLFWVQDFDAPMRIYEHVNGVKSDTHIKIALEAQYWLVDTIMMHCELYPSNAPIQPQIVTELKHVLLHANADFLTSDASVVPYDLPTLQNMLELTNQVVDYVVSQSQSQYLATPFNGTIELPAHLMCVLARLMRLFARSKFLNFYGQVSARLSANQSVYESERNRLKSTTSLMLANVFLCGAPAAQYKFLRDTWIDDILNYPRWSKYIVRLNSDWSNVTIFSTVMLAVDISFLAVPGIVDSAAVSISLSAMCSVSSLVVSMLLGGECRGWGTDSAEGAAAFMARMVHTRRDIEALAIMYSLPYAFLIWGMLCFVAALGITVFRSKGLVTLAIVSLCWVAVTSLTLWPAWWGKFSIIPASALSRKGGQARRHVV